MPLASTSVGIILIFFCVKTFAYEIPGLVTPASWDRKEVSLPSIIQLYQTRLDQEDIEVVFTSYRVPPISSQSQFDDYIGSLYPDESSGKPRISMKREISCQYMNTNCYVIWAEITRHNKRFSVIYLYFRSGRDHVIGMSYIPSGKVSSSRINQHFQDLSNAVR